MFAYELTFLRWLINFTEDIFIIGKINILEH